MSPRPYEPRAIELTQDTPALVIDTRRELPQLSASGVHMMPLITVAQFYEMVRTNPAGLRAVFELADNVEHIECDAGRECELRHWRHRSRTGPKVQS